MEQLVFGMMNLITQKWEYVFFSLNKLCLKQSLLRSPSKKVRRLEKVRQRRYKRYWLISAMPANSFESTFVLNVWLWRYESDAKLIPPQAEGRCSGNTSGECNIESPGWKYATLPHQLYTVHVQQWKTCREKFHIALLSAVSVQHLHHLQDTKAGPKLGQG